MDRNKRDKKDKRVNEIITIIIILLVAGWMYRENVLCEYTPIVNNNGSQMTSYEEVGEYFRYTTRDPAHYNSKGIYQKNGLMYQKVCRQTNSLFS